MAAPEEEVSAWSIRAARVDDVAALIGIERRAAALLQGHPAHALFSAHTLPADTHVAAARAGRSFVAQLGARVVGHALYERVDDVAHLLQMDVDPAFGRRGIGRALLGQACDAAAAEGLREMTLTTLNDVPWNARFYASAGFVAMMEDEWPPHLRDVMAEERALGFPMHLRVAMTRPLAAKS